MEFREAQSRGLIRLHALIGPDGRARMPLLLALCGDKKNLSAKEVPLNETASSAVTDTFRRQEEVFRAAQEVPFDENWQNDGEETFVAKVPSDCTVFEDLLASSDVKFECFNDTDLSGVRGLAIKTSGDDGDSILVQLFAGTQSLTRGRLPALLLHKGTFTNLEETAFRLADKLVCIVEGGTIKFRSLHNLSRVIDTSSIFAAATDEDVRAFVSKHSHLFEFGNVDEFIGRASRTTRRVLASLEKNEALKKHSAQTLEKAALEAQIDLDVENGKIVIPRKSKEITELLRFLNDGRYVGPVSRETFVTNSRRRAP